MSALTTYDLMGNRFACPAFQWIGQAFTSCDGCGLPYWDHSHDELPADRSAGGRMRHVVISRAKAAAVRAKWDPS